MNQGEAFQVSLAIALFVTIAWELYKKHNSKDKEDKDQ